MLHPLLVLILNRILQLAGYYYDTEQKKYFKILPGHNNINVFTKAKIIAKETEEKRQKDLIKMRDSPCSLPKVSRFKNNITLWLEEMKVGSINNTQMGIFQLRKNIAGLKPFWHEKVFPSEFGPYEQLKHCLQLLVSPLCDDIVGSWTVQKFLKQRLQLIHIKRRTPTKDNNTIPIEVCSKYSLYLFCFAVFDILLFSFHNCHPELATYFLITCYSLI